MSDRLRVFQHERVRNLFIRQVSIRCDRSTTRKEVSKKERRKKKRTVWIGFFWDKRKKKRESSVDAAQQ
jgi:hypothetical protein